MLRLKLNTTRVCCVKCLSVYDLSYLLFVRLGRERERERWGGGREDERERAGQNNHINIVHKRTHAQIRLFYQYIYLGFFVFSVCHSRVCRERGREGGRERERE